jgi:hypothetical protein
VKELWIRLNVIVFELTVAALNVPSKGAGASLLVASIALRRTGW